MKLVLIGSYLKHLTFSLSLWQTMHRQWEVELMGTQREREREIERVRERGRETARNKPTDVND